jgi:hypothetical protein
MWLKTRRVNSLLAPLARVVEGRISDGRLTGSFRGYPVEARPHSGYPITYRSATSGSVGPEPVNMLRLVLCGVRGRQFWNCQSAAGSYTHDLASRFTAGSLLTRFTPGEFKFEGVDTMKDSLERTGEKLVERLGMPIKANADPALQERLVSAGLFDELDALRWGGHPYLPKAGFSPGGRDMTELYMNLPVFARHQAAIEERLRAAGLPDLQTQMETQAREHEAKEPGRLQLDVEAGKAKVPDVRQFGELLEHAARIAEINASVNQSPVSSE